MKVEDYLPKVVEAMKWRGKMLAFPMGINTTAMFVNKAIYQKAGLPLPTDDLTWDDVIAGGKRLTSGEGPTRVWAVNPPAGYVGTWPGSYGEAWIDPDGSKVLVNNPRTLKLLTLSREIWEKHAIAPTPAEYAEINNPAQAPFTNSRVALFAGGTWAIDPGRKESFDWDLVEPPAIVDSGKKYRGAFCGTEEIFVVNGTPNEDPAADFAAWLCSPEHLTWAGNKGHIIPAHAKTAQTAFVNPQGETRPKNIQAFVRAASYAPPIMPHPIYSDLNKAWSAAVSKWYGSAASAQNTAPAEQALREAQTEMQRLLDDWNKANPK
jgi:multiple sugar transport system substrate-binding protein